MTIRPPLPLAKPEMMRESRPASRTSALSSTWSVSPRWMMSRTCCSVYAMNVLRPRAQDELRLIDCQTERSPNGRCLTFGTLILYAGGPVCAGDDHEHADTIHADASRHPDALVQRPGRCRSEEHTSELQSPCNLVC